MVRDATYANKGCQQGRQNNVGANFHGAQSRQEWIVREWAD